VGTGGETVTAGLSDPANREGLVGKAMQANTSKDENNAAQLASLERTNEFGRWPANIVISHSEGCRPLGRRRVEGDGHWPAARGEGGISTSGHAGQDDLPEREADDVVELYECADDCPVLAIDRQARTVEAKLGVGGAGPSRFFYVPKPSAAEKDAGLTAEEFPPVRQDDATHPPDGPGARNPRNRSAKPRLNNHPTVKPIDFMRWLVRLVTPPGGVVLDPFQGSGTTGCAAVLEGMSYVGVDQDERSCRIARARIEHWRPSQASLF
jgi:site-specific DNA-methyltransferase (adenine-specific)